MQSNECEGERLLQKAGDAVTRLTDAEIAEWDRRLKVGDFAENDVPPLLAELKAERERCAELRRLVEVYGGLLLRR